MRGPLSFRSLFAEELTVRDGEIEYPWERLVYPLKDGVPYRDRNGWVSSELSGFGRLGPLASYMDLPVIKLLGERGVGKTRILSAEWARLRAAGADCRLVDLPFLGSGGAPRLESVLAVAGFRVRYVLLDSLDEAIDRNPDAWPMLVRCLEDLGDARSGLRLRIACRSSRWPGRLQAAFESMWPGQVSDFGVASLTRSDVVAAAEMHGLGSAFVEDLERRRLVVPLASWPVTLKPLLLAAAEGRPIPANTVQAFEQACERLCTETDPARHDIISAQHPSPAAVLAAARRVAAALQFGAETALTDGAGDEPGLTGPELARGRPEPDLAGGQVECTEFLFRKLTESAQLGPLAPGRWGFVHHSFQEFLASRYLEVHGTSPEVRRALLLAGSGRGMHVIESQREVAAWLAVSDDGLFEQILTCDPQVLLLSDLAMREDSDRSRVTEALLRLTREDFTVQLDPLLLYRLDHAGLAGQLSPVLVPSRPQNELYAALWIARACPRPALNDALFAIIEDENCSESVRTLAVAGLDLRSSDQAVRRLVNFTEDMRCEAAAAALARLWPGYLPTSEMLARLSLPDLPAGSWKYLRQVPQLLTPVDLPIAVRWAPAALTRPGSRDRHALAIRILIRSVQMHETCHAGADDGTCDCAAQLARSVLNLLRDDIIFDHDQVLAEFSSAFAGTPVLRRAVARLILDAATAGQVGTVTVGSPLCLYPQDDAAYWASQIPALPDESCDRLRTPLGRVPDDAGAWARICELAEADARVRERTAHWRVLPINHFLAADARRGREAETRRHAELIISRYNESAITAKLTGLCEVTMRIRTGWFSVVIDFYRTQDGIAECLTFSLDLGNAPSLPAPGSEMHELLIRAATQVLLTAPVIGEADLNPAQATIREFPELIALGFLTAAGRLEPSALHSTRWRGYALALACVHASPDDEDFHAGLLADSIGRAGTGTYQAMLRLLDKAGSAAQYRVAVILGRILRTTTRADTAMLLNWARSPDRALPVREAVLRALAEREDEDAIASLRRDIASTSQMYDNNPASPAARSWISAAAILARYDTEASWPAILDILTAYPALARKFLDHQADHSSFGGWPIELGKLQPSQITELYDLVVTAGPADLSLDQPDITASRSASNFRQLRSQLIRIIANHPADQEAGQQIQVLADRHPDDWQLRDLARTHPRRLAAQTWQPVPIADLLRLADDRALRLVRNESHLSDVVAESLTRLQNLLSRPNGWAVLLWHRENFKAASGWWPAWEEDLSDLVATFLHYDLAESQVIINREVQVARPALNGRRTDIHVQAYLPGTPTSMEPLTVIIECKGCWHDDLDGGLSDQLVDKYLPIPGSRAGIYLIGYFDSPRWDRAKHPGRQHSFHELDAIRADQERIARQEALQKSVIVSAFVLDCRLPG